ncbi:hypothetical protein LCGC14_1201820 [marine sediment metagenome]|uniref:DUF5666 domain-containing protein n=1 Tax=marine sediment metagenome TaxID=412755 RepID=A0A0F9LGN4_9ZZZZ
MKKLITVLLVAVMIATVIPFVAGAKSIGRRSIILKGKVLKVNKHYLVMKALKANRLGRKLIHKKVVLRVTKNTKVLGNGGKRHISDLVKGERIFVRALKRRKSKTLLARVIICKKAIRGKRKAHKFIGIVKSISASHIKVKVKRVNRYSRKFRKKTITFPIHDGTKIRVDDKPAKITDIVKGDTVLVISKAPKGSNFFGAYLVNKITD